MAERNYLKHTVTATWGLIICLGLMYAIPMFDFGSFHFKRVNILADIMRKDATSTIAEETDHALLRRHLGCLPGTGAGRRRRLPAQPGQHRHA